LIQERTMSGLRFRVRPETFSIHRLPPDQAMDLARLSAAGWYSVTRTNDELSVVAPEGLDLGATDRQDGWGCLQIAAVLDLSEVGVLAGIAGVLAGGNISIFAISTYDTDYILVRSHDLDAAEAALTAAGHHVTRGV
jgi:hypothetical protein